MVSVTILGASGSIGLSALEIIRERRAAGEDFDIVALTANGNGDKLAALGAEFGAGFIALADETQADSLGDYKGAKGCGMAAVNDAASKPADIVLVAIAGVAALQPTLAAVRHAKRLAIANKECLVSAGRVVLQAARHAECQILPVDSEHNALFQLFKIQQEAEKEAQKSLRKIILTASGGPFRNLPQEQFSHITIKQALNHPNWSMGKKNTIDSATMMNKGLEVIEAHHLFGLPKDKIEVLIHPQSLVHAMVEYQDGCLLAHLSPTDMKLPIAYALDYPERKPMSAAVDFLDLAKIAELQFAAPDEARFPALALARQALAAGGTAPAVLNAANEVAVESFLQGGLSFCGISESVQYSLDSLDSLDSLNKSAAKGGDDIEAILAADAQARETAQKFIATRG